MAWKSYHFRILTSTNYRRDFFAAMRAFIVAAGWTQHDVYGGTKPRWSLTPTGVVANNETVVIGSKTYTFKATLTPAEGEVLIGANYTASMTNLGLAIDRADPGSNDGVKYKCAAANPYWKQLSLVSATLTIDWLSDVQATWEEGNVNQAPTETINNAPAWVRVQWGEEDRYVYKSRGESGKEPYGYVWLYNCAQSTYIDPKIYGYWDAGAHTGTRTPTRGSDASYRLTTFGNTYDNLMAGDKDMIYVSDNLSASYSTTGIGCSWGHLPVRGIPALTETTGAVVAGSSVSIPVQDATKLPGINGYFQIVGQSGEGCDRLQITSKPDSTHVVVASLPRNYASGAVCGQPASTFGTHSINNNWSDNCWRPAFYCLDAGLTVSATTYGQFAAINMATVSTFTGKIGITPLYIAQNGILVLGWIDKGVFCTAGYTHWDVAAMMNDGSTITANILATSGAAATITDTTKNWTVDEHAGKFVVIVGGTGISQVRKVVSNTSNTITVAQGWFTVPDSTSTFRVYDTIYRLLNYMPLWAYSPVLVTDTTIPV